MRKIIITFLILVSGINAMAQRTVTGFYYLEGNGSLSVTSNNDNYPMREMGGIMTLGLYTRHGAAGASVSMTSSTFLTADGVCYPYQDIAASCQYMYRLCATRNRTLNLYGGGGVKMGMQFADIFSYLPDYQFDIVRTTHSAKEGTVKTDRTIISGDSFFLLNIPIFLEVDLYIAPTVAFVIRPVMEYSLTSYFRKAPFRADFGLKVDL